MKEDKRKYNGKNLSKYKGSLHSNWRGGITGNFKLQYQLYKKRHPEKWKAQHILSNAVYNKKISKPDLCTKCDKKVPKRCLHGHHENYSKPLDVIWLCIQCHNHIHKGYSCA